MERRIWAAIALPVASWAMHVLAVLLLRPYMCTTWEPLLHVATAAALAGAAIGGWCGYSSWYTVGGGYDVRGVDAGTGRTRFFSLGGMALSLIFGLTIVAQWMSTLILSPCRA